MDDLTAVLDTGRLAFAHGDWQGAHRDLSRARELGTLPTADLDLLSRVCWWVGRARESLELSEDVYNRFEQEGDLPGAANKALNLGLLWFIRGDLVIASGWVNRARRILADLPEGVEHGYLRYLDAIVELDFYGLGPARESAVTLREMGQRLHAPQLTSLGLVLSGLADAHTGNPAAGFAQLDEAMLPVLAGQLPAEWAGDVYCTVIHTCHSLGDLSRMRAWTAATEQWCEQFHGEVVYSGICRVHRLQLLCTQGDWSTAEAGIERSGAELTGLNNWVAGEAYYQLGEIRRLRGDAGGARAAFDRARDLGAETQPGAALLDLAGGHVREASAALRAALAGRDRLSSARLLGPAVEIALAQGRTDEADRLCGELEAVATEFATEGFRTWAVHARSAVLVAQGRHEEALPVLRRAAVGYRALQARYETARIYELSALAHTGLGDEAAAESDLATAVAIYGELGAAPDVARLDAGPLPGGLTAREAEVLRLIAAGASNRDAAAALFISAKTVDRHLANIFAKIDVSSRTAAAAWAHEHRLSGRR
ncbi:LuxR C-terminal-related transcriptional regulator [Occultella kanbiaonis]|uniref:LuxR C-terminal-related transcriptional regulator n=1 Tax=Occultella kanbiaonis TaxID=2675754 RepID=UPI0013D4CEC4|nr:LuxR C-terminal-related transcriptional regulator [Occultella kanbiaonis]